MRILNIRLKNINSLAGEWYVNLEDPQYRDNGIFLITGPTGAGKTTLLDAICLALYGRTPRVGSITKHGNDIMTRHTGECLAEVTFEAPAGRFRALWGQTRANGKAGGNLQQTKRKLVREDGKELATKVEEFNDAIKKITGLGYEEFTRSMLLTQGHFADFLNGDQKAKASILEQLTDTSIYTDLSVECGNVRAEKKTAFGDLKKSVDALAGEVLSLEEEAAKKAQLEECARRLEELAKAIELCGQQLAWLKELEKIAAEAKALEAEKHELEVALEEFAPKREEMENAKQAARFEGAYAILERDRQLKKFYLLKIEKLDIRLRNLQKELALCGARVDRAQKNMDKAAKELEAARPQLEKARALDKRISEKKLELQTLLLAEKQSAENLLKKNTELDEAKQEKSAIEANLEQIGQWLAEHAADQWLVENLAALEEKLRRYEEAWVEVAEAEQAAAEAHNNLLAVQTQINEAEIAGEKARKTLADRQRAYDDIKIKREEMLGGQTLEDLRSLLDSARQAQIKAALYKSLEEHRKDLVDGEPCPCCGSKDHPFASGNLPDPDQLERRCKELELQIHNVEELEESLSRMEKEKDAAANELKSILERIKSLREQEAICQENWQRLARRAANARKKALAIEEGIRDDLAHINLENLRDLSGVGELLRARLDAWRQHLQAKSDGEKRRGECEIKVARLEADVEAAQKDLAEKSAAVRIAQKALRELSEERAALFGGRSADAVEQALKMALEQAQASYQLALADYSNKKAELDSCEGERNGIQRQLDELEPRLAGEETGFASSLAENGLNEAAFLAMRREPEYLRALEQEAEGLATWQTELETKIQENKKRFEEEKSRALTDQDIPALEAEQAALNEEQAATHDLRAQLKAQLENSDRNREKLAGLNVDLEKASEEFNRWEALYKEIGGDKETYKFSRFAQNVTLDLLLAHANAQLAKITDRYVLQRSIIDPLKNMEIEVIDNEHAGVARSIKNLSGGEMFIASLSLALGLSAMSGKNAMLGSLFLDEGFGTLDSETLETAINAIGSLRQEGKLIGIISHVESLADRIPTQIHVQPGQMGRSVISGPGCVRVTGRKER